MIAGLKASVVQMFAPVAELDLKVDDLTPAPTNFDNLRRTSLSPPALGPTRLPDALGHGSPNQRMVGRCQGGRCTPE